MPDGQVLEFSGVSKRFGAVTAVSELSARVEPGQVTGFLGPNGAGKTTSLRILLGLVRASDGTATIGGVPYRQLKNPLREVGAVLESSSFHPGRSAANHLAVYAQAAGLGRDRVDAVLETVGLADVAGRKVGGFSLGMRQRLGLATALLGDPGVLVLDEPSNGLDPEGIRWMRSLLRRLAEEGRTVLISSHQLAEVQQTVDTLLIIANGRLVFRGDFEDLAAPDDIATIVDAPDRPALQAAIEREGFTFDILRSGLTVRGAEPAQVGAIASAAGIALSTLQRKGAGLEDVFLDLVNGVRVQPSAGAAVTGVEAEPGPGSGKLPDSGPAALDTPDSGDSPDPGKPAEAHPSTDLVPIIRPAASAEQAAAQPATDVDASTSGNTFTVATTGVIDIVPAGTGSEGESWLDDIRPGQPAPGGEEAPPDDGNGELTDAAPQEQPEQPGALPWSAEPIEPEGELPDEREEESR